jgi:hypothetical protein
MGVLALGILILGFAPSQKRNNNNNNNFPIQLFTCGHRF